MKIYRRADSAFGTLTFQRLIWIVLLLLPDSMSQIFLPRSANMKYNPGLMRLYVVGGGGCLIRNLGAYDKSRVTILDDICATAKGYESLAYMSLKRRG